jgi:hypothetical protein
MNLSAWRSMARVSRGQAEVSTYLANAERFRSPGVLGEHPGYAVASGSSRRTLGSYERVGFTEG